jgi:hypothetical protein
MTTKITVEKISADEIRVTLVAQIQITGNLIPAVPEVTRRTWPVPPLAGPRTALAPTDS